MWRFNANLQKTTENTHTFISRRNGIPEFLDSGRKSWTLHSGRWTLDSGRCTLEAELWTLDAGPLDAGRWTLDAEDAEDAGS